MTTTVTPVSEFRTAGKPVTLLRQTRLEAKMTLDRAAEEAGISASHLSRMERAESVPSISVALRLCGVYGMDAEDLFGEWSDLRVAK